MTYHSIPVMERIMDKLSYYHLQFNYEPKAILLGPNEYLSLITELMQQMKYQGPTPDIVYPTTFLGFPIRVKMGAGVDVEIEIDDVFRFAKGLISSTDS